MMNFDLSDNQELYKATARKFFSTLSVADKVTMRMTADGYSRKRWEELAQLGMIMLAASEENGGMGGSLTDLAVIAEAAGAGCAIDPWLENAVIPTRLLDESNEQTVLPEILAGSKIAAIAFAETASRYNLDRIETKADRTSSGYMLNGRKQFVLGGHIADYFLVTTSIDDEFSILLVPAKTDGVQTFAYQVADGSKAVEVEFISVELPVEARLDLSVQTFKHVVSETNLLACAEMIGLCQLLLDETLEYVKQREQFGVSIGSFQVVQHALVDCYAAIEQMRSILLRNLLEHPDQSIERQLDISGAKAFVAERADFIARNSVQYFGAMGITEEAGIGSALKRIMLLSRLFGDVPHCIAEYSRVA
ncbi:MAG: acyl-CoA dehydrogenase family protein [Hyphomonadaceae bacterium]